MKAAVVRDGDGLVVNVIAVANLRFPVGPGHTLRNARGAGPGWTWVTGNFNPPPLPPPGPTDADIADAKIAADNALLGIVRYLAGQAATTEQAVRTAIKAKL